MKPKRPSFSCGNWHRTCFQDTVHVDKCKRARQKEIANSAHSSKFTRSQTVPYNSNLFFFCDGEGDKRSLLYKLVTSNAGEALKNAIPHSKNDKLVMKLSTPIDETDVHAINVLYHNKSWTKNITNT